MYTNLTSHIDVRYHFVREAVANQTVRVEYTSHLRNRLLRVERLNLSELPLIRQRKTSLNA